MKLVYKAFNDEKKAYAYYRQLIDDSFATMFRDIPSPMMSYEEDREKHVFIRYYDEDYSLKEIIKMEQISVD